METNELKNKRVWIRRTFVDGYVGLVELYKIRGCVDELERRVAEFLERLRHNAGDAHRCR